MSELLMLLSPAKSLDYETPSPSLELSVPEFESDAAKLIALLRAFSVNEVAQLMDLSENLATLNVQRYAQWRKGAAGRARAKAAILAFNGDVYEGLQAKTLAVADLQWAQGHIAILSGLYGLLRPLDALQPYRLEMGTRVANASGKDLYAWWGKRLAQAINGRFANPQRGLVVNLASQEYAKAVDKRALEVAMVDCVFEDHKAGQWKVMGVHAKRARGLMARHATLKRAAVRADLEDFEAEGYAYVAQASDESRLVFRRRLQE